MASIATSNHHHHHHHHRRHHHDDFIFVAVVILVSMATRTLALDSGAAYDSKVNYFLSNTPVGCEYFPCKNRGTCVQLAGGDYTCKCPNLFGGQNCELALSTCTCKGATHCRTYDRALIDYPGKCRFLLSRFEGRDPVSVYARRQPNPTNNFVVYISGVDVALSGGVNVSLYLADKDLVKAKVNGINVELPYSASAITNSPNNRPGFDVFYVSTATVRFQLASGFKVDFNKNWYVKVLSPFSYKNQMSGVCGNFDGNIDNDYVTKTGLNVSSSKTVGIDIGNSYVEDTDKTFGECQVGTIPVPAKCPDTVTKVGSKVCSYLSRTSTEAYLFLNCLDVFDANVLAKFFEHCNEDVTKTCDIESALVLIRVFVTACNNNGILVADWSAVIGDTCTCPNSRMTCNRFATGCIDTCMTRLKPAQPLFCPYDQCLLETFNNVCECPYGTVYHNGSCIVPTDCGCVDPVTGKVYKVNETWLSNDCYTEYTCLRNNVTTSRATACPADKECVKGICKGCTPSKCVNGVCYEYAVRSLCLCNPGYSGDACNELAPGSIQTVPPSASCTVTTGQHITTFDGTRFNYRGNCRYLLLSLATTANAFTLHVNSIGQPRTRNVSYAQSVELNYKKNVIKLERRLDSVSYLVHVSINGVPQEAPVTTNKYDFTVVFNGDYVEIRTPFGLTVAYNTNWRVKVTLTNALSKLVAGLCGNFDGDPDNDFKLASGVGVKDAEAVVNSYVVRCPADDSSLAPPPCDQPPSNQRCEQIINEKGPFRDCLKFLGLQTAGRHAANCVDDVTRSCSDVMACQSLEDFSRTCYDAGSTVDANWRDVASCPSGCPDPGMERALITTACRTTCYSKTCTLTPNLAMDICICPTGKMLFNGSCILEQDCGCIDASGSAQDLNSSWLTNSCRTKFTCLPKGGLKSLPFKCPTGTVCSGTTCSSCSANPCQNEAECVDTSISGDYLCKCKPGFSGVNCTSGCNDKMDIVFIIDNTPSQCQNDPTFDGDKCNQWKGVLNYVAQVMTYLQIGASDNNVALVKLSSTASLIGRGFLNSKSLPDLLTSTKISTDNGPANIEAALQFVRNAVFTKTFDRTNAPNFVIFLLNSWAGTDFGIEVELGSAEFLGAKYFAVLTSYGVPLDSVINLVSRSSTRNYFLAPSINDISTTRDALQTSFNLCAASKSVTCTYVGDGRAESFDGLKLEYKGTCKFLLLAYESPTLNVSVYLKNYLPYPSGYIVYPKTVAVKLNGRWVRMERRLLAIGSLVNLWVDEIERSPPYNAPDFSVYYNGDSLELNTNAGLKVSLSKLYHVKISLNPTFKKKVRGFCGNYDGDDSNDLKTADGVVVVKDAKRVYGTTIGNSYVVAHDMEASNGTCVDTTFKKDCTKRTTECNVINDPNGVFGACVKKFPALAQQYKEQCEDDVLDLCQPMSGIECQAYAEFDRICQDREVFVDWRMALGCDSQCPVDMISVVRGSACLPTCSNPDAVRTCLLPDVADTCVCPSGKVLFNQRCVEPKKCGCVDEYGKEYPIGDVWLSHNCSRKQQCDPVSKLVGIDYACQKDYFCDNEQCIGCSRPLDIAFVLDESGSVCMEDKNIQSDRDGTILGCDSWTYVLQAMANILKDLTIGPNDVQVAVIKFSTSASLIWNLDYFKTKSALLDAISRLDYKGGFTNMAAALRVMRTEVFGSPADRPYAQNLLIFVTDGVPTVELQALPGEVFEAYMSPVKRVAVGITDFIDERNLMALCDPPHHKDKNYFIARGFAEVEFLRKKLQAGLSMCPDTRQYTCECWGDVHCRTFDGKYLDYPGLCKTQLSKSSSLNYPFSISLKNYRSVYSNYSSYVSFIEVNMTGDVVRIEKTGDSWSSPVSVSLNDIQIVIPFKHPKFSFDYYGEFLELSTDYGLTIGFSSRSRFYIDLPKTLSYSVNGFCGNFDDNAANDALQSNKIPASNLDSPGKEVGDSYLTVDTGSLPACKAPPPIPPPCDQHLESLCAKIIDIRGPFATCIALLGDLTAGTYFQQCLDDIPKSCSKDGVCASVDDFVAKCRDEGWKEAVASQWRVDLGCACTCDNPDMVCRPFGPPCINTCANQTASAQCLAPNVYDVCVCKDPSKVNFNGQCVDPATCGCIDRSGRARKVGETYLEAGCTYSSKCSSANKVESSQYACPDGTQCYQDTCTPCQPNNPCLNGGKCVVKQTTKFICKCPDAFYGKNCEKERKTAICRLWPGVDLLTFDSAYISYSGAQKYLLTKGTFERNQFLVFAKNYWSCDAGSTRTAYVRYVEFVYNGFKVHLERSEEGVFASVLAVVNDLAVNVPFKNQHFSIDYVGEYVEIKTFFGLLLGFSSQSRVRITLPSISLFLSNVRGLCGNFDLLASNDYITESGLDVSASATAGTELVNGFDSYVTDKALDSAYFESCDDDLPPSDIKGCTSKPTSCDEISNESGVFVWCNALLEPYIITAFKNSCVANFNRACQTGDEALMKASTCDVISSFAYLCQTRLGWLDDVAPQWREQLACPCDYKRTDMMCADQTPSCLPSCTYPKAAASCDLPVTFFGPKCDDAQKVVYKGVCIDPSLCGCVDDNGRPRSINETWLANSCSELRTCIAPNKTTSKPNQCKSPNKCVDDQCIGCNQLTSVAFLIQDNALSCEKDWPYIKQLIADVIKLVKVGSSKVNVALVTFSDKVNVVLPLTGNPDTRFYLQTLSNIQCTASKTTNLANGLKTIREQIYSGDRSSNINYLVTVTNGPSNADNHLVNPELYRLKVKGVNFISVAVGGTVDLARVMSLASQPAVKDKNFFLASNFSDLANVRLPLRNALNLCFSDKPYRCECYGDIHCSTFDNLHMDYQGICKFLLIESNSVFGKFKVYMKSLNLYNVYSISFVEYVEVVFGNRVVRLQKKDPKTSSVVQAVVDNNVVGIPSTFPGFSFRYNGNYAELVTSFGLIAALNKDWKSYVDLQRTFAYDTHGFCGNFDGSLENDVVFANGTAYDSKLNRGKVIGDSYVLQPANESCYYTPPLAPKCKLQPVKCDYISDVVGPFASCIGSIGSELAKTYQDECVLDFNEVCSEDIACKLVEEFADACRRAANDSVAADWRAVVGCGCSCGQDDMKCLPTGPMCVNTCEEPNATDDCALPIGYDVCVCKDDTKVQFQGTCIERSKCGCLDDDQTSHEIGTSWFDTKCTQKSTCVGNKKIDKEPFSCPDGTNCVNSKCTACEPNPCENGGVCSDDGDRQYRCKCPAKYYGLRCEKRTMEYICQCQHGILCRTFDGAELEFSTNKKWLLVASDDPGKNFTVVAKAYRLWEESSEYQDSYFRYIQVYLGKIKVHFELDVVDQSSLYSEISVSVNNKRVQIPYKLNPDFAITYIGSRVTLLSKTGMFVSVSNDGFVAIGLSVDDSFSVYGYCGNDNGDALDDRRKKGGVVLTEEEEDDVIGESYVVEEDYEEELVYDFGRPPRPEPDSQCPIDPSRCKGMYNLVNNPFSDCLRVLPPKYMDSLVQRCVRNVKTYCNDKFLCKMLYELALTCSKVVDPASIKTWRDAFGCPCTSRGDLACNNFGPPCIDTCQEPDATKYCKYEPIFVPDSRSCSQADHVLSDYGACVARDACGCVDEYGGARANGEIWLSGDCAILYTCSVDEGVITESFACGRNEVCDDGFCRGCDTDMDVAFLLEESNSVCEDDPTATKGPYSVASCGHWTAMLRFTSDTVKYLNLKKTRLAFVKFADQANLMLGLKSTLTQSKRFIIETITNSTLDGGSRRLAQALKVIRSLVFNGPSYGDRGNAPNTLVLVTLGRPADPDYRLNHQLHEARINGLKLLVVGVADEKKDEEGVEFLKQLAKWSKQKSFLISNLDDLEKSVSDRLHQELSKCGHKSATCSCTGHTDCLTFDQFSISHRVQCPVLLAELALSDSNLRVVVETFDDQVATAHHRRQNLFISYNGVNVEVYNGVVDSYSLNLTVKVNEVIVEIPYQPKEKPFKIRYNGMNLEFITTTPGLADDEQISVGVGVLGKVYITLPARLQLTTHGLCGDYDGDADNDKLTAEGKAVEVADEGASGVGDSIAISYMTLKSLDQDNIKSCLWFPPLPPPDCQPTLDRCQLLKATTDKFKSCAELTPPTLANRYYDICVREAEEFCDEGLTCAVMRDFVEFCRRLGAEEDELEGWKEVLGCPCTCDSNATTCQPKASACLPTCDSNGPESVCQLGEARDVCVCSKPGQVFFKGRCIDSEECGCVSVIDGSSYELGATWLNGDCTTKSTCSPNREIVEEPFTCDSDMQCSFGQCFYCQPTSPCKNDGQCFESTEGYYCKCKPGYFGRNCEKKHDDGECSCWVGVNCLTFDGAAYNSVTGLSRFLLSGSSSTKCPFRVYAKLFRPCDDPIAVVRYVEIEFGNLLFRLEREEPESDTTTIIVTIGGQTVELPVTTEQYSIRYRGNDVIFESFCGLDVLLGGTSLRLNVPNTLIGKLSGMCGNFDDDVTNDIAPSPLAFDLSDVDIMVPEEGDDVFDICGPGDMFDPCDKYLEQCEQIKNATVFSLCLDLLKAEIIESFYQSCISNVRKICYSQLTLETVICQIQREFIETCRYHLGFDDEVVARFDPTNKCACPKSNDTSLKCLPKTSPCVNTCANPKAETKCLEDKPAFNVLKCSDPNKLLFKGMCVDPSVCGCVDELGKAREIGEQWLSPTCDVMRKCESANTITQTKFNCTSPNTCKDSFCVGCDQPKDIFVLLQSSSTICSNDPTITSDKTSCSSWTQLLQFVADVLKPVKLAADKNRVALVTFAAAAKVEFNLDEIYDDKKLTAKIQSTKLTTKLDYNLTAGLTSLLGLFGTPKDRNYVPNHVIIVTMTSLLNNLKDRAQIGLLTAKLNASKANVVSLGVVGDLPLEEAVVKSLSSAPSVKNKNYFMVASTKDLYKMRNDVQKSIYICDEKPSRCECYGDLHCSTFDNLHMDYQGICEFLLVESPPSIQTGSASFSPSSTPLPSFKVYMKAMYLYNVKVVSFVEELRVVMGNYSVVLRKKDPNVKGPVVPNVNGINVAVPSKHNGFTFRFAGDYVELVTSYGLVVALNKEWKSYVELPRAFAYSTRGFCGNYDGDLDNDLVFANGTAYNSKLNRGKFIGDSYVVGIEDGNDLNTCSGPEIAPGDMTDCTKPTTKCDSLNDPTGIFAKCYHLLNAQNPTKTAVYQSECLLDLRMVCLDAIDCMVVEQYVSECRSLAGNGGDDVIPVGWRTNVGCPCTCNQTDQICQEVAPACSDTCLEPDLSQTCELPPLHDVCVCKDATFTLFQGRCVAKEMCGCYDDVEGTEHELNTTWITRDCLEQATCNEDRTITKVSHSCPAGTYCYINNCTACQPNPCQNKGRCEDIKDNKYRCTCPPGFYGKNCQLEKPYSICKCVPGSYCQTFDGLTLEYTKASKWFLLQSTTEHRQNAAVVEGEEEEESWWGSDFAVYARSVEDCGTEEVWVQYVEVMVGGYLVRMEKVLEGSVAPALVTVNDREVLVPYKSPSYPFGPNNTAPNNNNNMPAIFDISYYGSYVSLNTRFGLQVQFNSLGVVNVILLSKSFDQLSGSAYIKGFCGNNDGIWENDLVTKEGKDLYVQINERSEDEQSLFFGEAIADSFQVQTELEITDDCQNIPEPDSPRTCDKDTDTLCDELLKSDGIFAACVTSLDRRVLNRFYGKCTRAWSRSCDSDGVCKVLQEFVSICSLRVEVELYKAWRKALGCPCHTGVDHLSCNDFGSPCNDEWYVDVEKCYDVEELDVLYCNSDSRYPGPCGPRDCIDQYGSPRLFGEVWLSEDCGLIWTCSDEGIIISEEYKCPQGSYCSRSQCVGCKQPMDIAFLIDESTSMCGEGQPRCDEWSRLLLLIGNVVKNVDVARNRSSVGLVKFNDEARVIFDLGQFFTKKPILDSIYNLTIVGGDSNIGHALRVARKEMFDKAKCTGKWFLTPKMLVLVTDGNGEGYDNQWYSINHEVYRLRLLGVELVTLALTGDNEQIRQLKLISKAFNLQREQTSDTFFQVSSIQDVGAIEEQLIDVITNCRHQQFTCSCFGNFHCLTFDRAELSYFGTCPFLLAKFPFSGDRISVFVTNDGDFEAVSARQVVEVVGVAGMRVKFVNGYQGYGAVTSVYVNGNLVEIPFKRKIAQLRYRGMNTELVLLNPNKTYDIEEAIIGVGPQGGVYVTLNSDLQMTSEGFCGDYDGEAGNDLVTSDGRDVSGEEDYGKLIGDSYLVEEDDDQACEAVLNLTPCSSGVQKCNQMFGNSTENRFFFSECNARISDRKLKFFHQACIKALTQSCKTRLACKALSNYVEECRLGGGDEDVLARWREIFDCPCTCDSSDMTCVTETFACPPTCYDTEPGQPEMTICDLGQARDVCVCSRPEQVMFRGRCVDVEQCGCVTSDDGVSHELSTSWLVSNCTQNDTCSSSHVITSQPYTCPDDLQCNAGTCSACLPTNPCKNSGTCQETGNNKYICICKPRFYGDNCQIETSTCQYFGNGHAITFDGAHLDFLTTCKFTLVEYTETDSEKKPFAVHLRLSKRNGFYTLKYMEIVYAGYVIRLMRSDKRGSSRIIASINGQQVDNYPVRTKHFRLYLHSNWVQFESKSGHLASLSTDWLVEVSLSLEAKSKVSGLCGNYDDVTDNDYVTAKGADVSGRKNPGSAIGLSYLVTLDPEKGLDETCEAEIIEEIEEEELKKKVPPSIKSRCDLIGQFSNCTAHLKAGLLQYYTHTCLIDGLVTCTGGADSDYEQLYCQSVEALVESCHRLGQPIYNWRKLFECECNCIGRDQACVLPSAASSSCVATCGDLEAEKKCRLATSGDGCTCGDGKVLHSGACISVTDCNCVDDDGVERKINEEWYDDACTLKYMCTGPGTIVVEKAVQCGNLCKNDLIVYLVDSNKKK